MTASAQIEHELARGEAARAAGNVGRARVCARRAAGLAVRAWYQRQQPGWGGDAMQQLRRLQADAAVPLPVRQAAERLTTKVDFDHQLPFDNDALEDARVVVEFARSNVETRR